MSNRVTLQTVADRVGDVVGADVLPEHTARVLVAQADRGAGEPDERGVRQGVAEVLGIADDVLPLPLPLCDEPFL